MVRLTAAEARCLERAYLGGMEALRTPEYSVACKVVHTLVQAGMFDRNGLTPLGHAVGKALGQPEE